MSNEYSINLSWLEAKEIKEIYLKKGPVSPGFISHQKRFKNLKALPVCLGRKSVCVSVTGYVHNLIVDMIECPCSLGICSENKFVVEMEEQIMIIRIYGFSLGSLQNFIQF